MAKVTSALEWLAIIVLILAGVGGILVSVTDLLVTDIAHSPFSWLKNPQTLTLLLLAVLVLAVGLERAADKRHIERRVTDICTMLQRMENRLVMQRSVVPLAGHKLVRSEAQRLVSVAERRIIGTSFGHDPKPIAVQGPDTLTERYALRLSEVQSLGRHIRLDLVVGSDSDYRVTANRHRRLVARHSHFEQRQVTQSVRYYVVPAQIGVDVLAIDDLHVILAPPWTEGNNETEFGLCFTNTPDVAREFVDWLDGIMRSQARVYATPYLIDIIPEVHGGVPEESGLSKSPEPPT